MSIVFHLSGGPSVLLRQNLDEEGACGRVGEREEEGEERECEAN